MRFQCQQVLHVLTFLRFMESLQWVDQTYIQKHKSEDPKTLRAMYYPNLRMYSTHGVASKHRAPMDAAIAFLMRFGRRAAISLAVYLLSYLPVVGRFVLPAASFYTVLNAAGPIPATVIFGSGIFLPRRYLVVFLQSYFSSRSLVRELVSYPQMHNCLFVGFLPNYLVPFAPFIEKLPFLLNKRVDDGSAVTHMQILLVWVYDSD